MGSDTGREYGAISFPRIKGQSRHKHYSAWKTYYNFKSGFRRYRVRIRRKITRDRRDGLRAQLGCTSLHTAAASARFHLDWLIHVVVQASWCCKATLSAKVFTSGVYTWKIKGTFDIYIQKARVGRASGSLSKRPSLAGCDTLLG